MAVPRRWSSVACVAAVSALIAVSACGVPVATPAPAPDSSVSVSTPADTPAPSDPTETATDLPTTASPTPTQAPTPTPTPTEKATQPTALMARGATGEKVRELQHRLRQLDWYAGDITGTYAESTVSSVKGFQGKRSLTATGAVDQKTWTALTSRTRMPSADEMHNRLKPGPAILKAGATSDQVRELQARLKQIGWYSGTITAFYGSATTSGVKGFQGKRAIPVTGDVDQRTWSRLTAMTRTPTKDEKNNVVPKPSATGLDSRCLTAARAMCISKRTNSLVWVVGGKPQVRVDVRFGSQELPTREGSFTVGWKSRNHVSSIYHTSMPFAMFFSGGQAVHYSPDFAARGYNGASHGCVNVRNRQVVEWLFDTVRVGDAVIVYR